MYVETYRMDTSDGYYTEGQINSEDDKPVDGVIGDVLALDAVCGRNLLDGSYGWYDKVSEAFYTNSEAVYTAGPDVSDPVEIYTDGTAEVLTITATGAETQTVANIPDLYSTLDGSVSDEVNLVSGVVTRRTEVVYEDGGIVVKALVEPVIEQTTAHRLRTSEGDNTVSVTANVSSVELAVEYAKEAS